MGSINGNTKAIIFVVLSGMFLYFTYYIFTGLADLLPDNTLKTIYWIALLFFCVIIFIIYPILFSMDKDPSLKQLMIGLGIFIAAYGLCFVVYFLSPTFIDLIGSISPVETISNTLEGMCWLMVLTIYIGSMLFAPIGYVMKGVMEANT